MSNRTFWQELKGTLQLGLPLILTQLLGFGQQVVDTVMAGKHNALTLAAVSLAGQIFALVYLLMVGIGVALSASVSRYEGKGDAMRIRRSFQQGVWLMLFLGALTFVLLTMGAYVPQLIGSHADIAREAKKYLFAVAPGGALFVFALSARYFLEGMAYPRSNIFIQITLLPLNVFLNWAYLSGWWIFPALGAQGMALATTICYSLYALLIFTTIWRNPKWAHLRLFQRFAPPQFIQIRALLKIGIPISLTIVMEAALFISVGLIVSRSDAIITGANQIAANYASIMFMIPLGLSSALTIRIAHAMGQGNQIATRQRALGGITFAGILMLISALFMTIFAREIAGLYSDNLEVIAISTGILSVIAVFQLFDGIQVAASGVLRGMEDTKIAMIYALIGYWLLGFPLGLVFAYGLDYGVYGLWAGIAVGLAINAILATRRVWYKTQN